MQRQPRCFLQSLTAIAHHLLEIRIQQPYFLAKLCGFLTGSKQNCSPETTESSQFAGSMRLKNKRKEMLD